MAEADEEQGIFASGLSLYQEARQPMQAAFFMFFFPDIRGMAKKGQLTKSDPELIQKLVDLPINAWEVNQIYKDNKDEIIETCIQDEDRADMYRGALMGDAYLDGDEEDRADSLENTRVLYFEDGNQETDLVWGLAVNHSLRRIQVAFRGSVSKKDFQQDAKARFSPIPNPVKVNETESERDSKKYPEIVSEDRASEDLPSEVMIHLGFREYLYGEQDASWLNRWLIPGLIKKQSTEKIEKLKKFEVILEATSRICKENPGFHLYIAGHSLGGALATLFAFQAAAAPDEDIPKPVTCITSGAPKVGNLDFLRAFETLEERRKLRCLRITNYRDIVPLAPPNGSFSLIHACCLQRRRFRHVGMRLKLLPRGRFLVSYPPRMQTCFGIMLFDIIKVIRHYFYLLILCPLVVLFKRRYTYHLYRNEHTQLAYTNRFDLCKEDLEQLSLDQLYNERISRAKWRLPIAHTSDEYYRWFGGKTTEESRQ